MKALAIALALIATPVAAEKRLYLFFTCETSESATTVGRTLAGEDHPFPEDCRWLHGLGLPDQAGHLLEVVAQFAVDGKGVEVGRVRVNNNYEAYSAGLITELLLF